MINIILDILIGILMIKLVIDVYKIKSNLKEILAAKSIK